MRLSAARSAFLAPKARAISRAPTLPPRSRINAINSGFEGRWVRFIGRSLAVSLPGGPLRKCYSAACVVLRGGLPLPGRLPERAPGRLPEALIWRAVPGDGRLVLRGRACG